LDKCGTFNIAFRSLFTHVKNICRYFKAPLFHGKKEFPELLKENHVPNNLFVLFISGIIVYYWFFTCKEN
jgi:hypothetical protein